MTGVTVGTSGVSVSCGSASSGGKNNLVTPSIGKPNSSTLGATFENIQVCIYPSGTMRFGKCPEGIKGVSMILFGVKN
jgi:hypothetical protein